VSLPAEILKKVKLLELSTRKLVNNLFAGEYHSAFKGQGMTFSEFREYAPGDDVRAISWPVTARMGKPFIKKSGAFGSKSYFKGEVIAHLAALLSFSAAKNNDPVGLILFSDQVEHFVPPKKGRGHVYRILRDLYYFKPISRGTKMSVALDHLLGMLRKRSTVFVFSDFLDTGFDRSLRQLGRKHDLIACVVQDPGESEMPNMGLVEFEDAETGESMTVDTSSVVFRRDYAEYMKQIKKQRDDLLKKAQVERVDIISGENFVDPLIGFFKKRNKK
jgi:uncharacterized protein (DUF58 family)